MLNFVFLADAARHHCELQLCHPKMLALRKQGGGHEQYAECRGVAELLEAMFNETSSEFVMRGAVSICQGKTICSVSSLADDAAKMLISDKGTSVVSSSVDDDLPNECGEAVHQDASEV